MAPGKFANVVGRNSGRIRKRLIKTCHELREEVSNIRRHNELMMMRPKAFRDEPRIGPFILKRSLPLVPNREGLHRLA